MKSSSLAGVIAIVLGGERLTIMSEQGARRFALPGTQGPASVARASEFKTTRSRNGSKPSGAASLKRTAKTRRMAKARRSKR